MQNRLSACLFTMLGFLLLLPGSAQAQFSMLTDRAPHFEWRGQFETDFRTEFKTKTDGGDSFESWRLGIGGHFGGPINESILIGIRGSYHFSEYNFRQDNSLGSPSGYGSNELPHDPWGPISTIDLSPGATILVGDRFSVVAAVPIRWSAETGSSQNAFTAGISGLVRWQVTDLFRIGLGIGVTSQLEHDTETFPIISLDWQISDSMEFQTTGSWTQGGQAALVWGPNKSVRVTFSAGYERNRFRLDDNGFQADRNGIGEISAVPLEIGLRFRLYERAFFDFRVGLNVAGRIQIRNDNGRRLYDQNYDPSPHISLGLRLPFGQSRSPRSPR